MSEPIITTSFKVLSSFMTSNPGVNFVRLLWVDLAFTIRARVLTADYFRQLLNQHSFLKIGANFLSLVDNEAPLNVNRAAWSVGQCCLVPDQHSIRLWPSDETHAVIFCYFAHLNEESPPQARYHPLCPRRALHKSLNRAEDIDLGLLVGTEIEFVCTQNLGANATQHAGTEIPVHQVSGLRCFESYMLPILCEVTDHLRRSKILVHQVYVEGGIGQFEVSVEPLPPTEALDSLILVRETIWNICHRHRVRVSFHPRVGSPGRWAYNGVHLNISLHGKAAGQGGADQQFIAGVFEHMDSLFALGLPHPESYHRVQPNLQAIGVFKAWGTENRTVPIRRKGNNFWEIRFVDASSNVYLLLAAVVATGVISLRGETSLRLRDCNVDPARINEEERLVLGISEKVPSCVEDSFEALRLNTVLASEMSTRLVSCYLSLMESYNKKLKDQGDLGSQERYSWLAARL
ncbi:hypothetical protein S7711_01297 [Stachybotrys chartarum IBT 7711]|uniref:GS catalytic domain-containing protein n=1 Tax=Stachybotrys chartarum (strain CBS 109288 / IBT 7711) TaxID=1280523 RepID=A0A084BBL9_STACB|nr:hypothetical protein S7711_01297 [Stachybotrys chartarum IBT 7711]